MNVLKIKNVLLLFAACTLPGCSSTSDTRPESFTPSPEKGVAIGTITIEGLAEKPLNDIYRFFYEPVSDNKKFVKQNDGKIVISGRVDNDRAFNGDFNEKRTYLFIIEGEPGKYNFNQYSFLDHIGSNGMVNFSKEFSIPFDIKKREITYIGELAYNDTAERGTARIIVSDSYERDMKEFRKKYPAVNWDTVADNTVKSGDTGEGIIEFRTE